MLIFLDESGDTGYHFEKGSSHYFVVGLVIFHDHDQAIKCDQAIQALKEELGCGEFHFSSNRDYIRKAFLKTVSKYRFEHSAKNIDKTKETKREDLYEHTCRDLIETISPYPSKTTLTMDQHGGIVQQGKLKRDLKNALGLKMGLKVKFQNSRKNNLLQLADYYTSLYKNKFLGRIDKNKYYKYIQNPRK